MYATDMSNEMSFNPADTCYMHPRQTALPSHSNSSAGTIRQSERGDVVFLSCHYSGGYTMKYRRENPIKIAILIQMI